MMRHRLIFIATLLLVAFVACRRGGNGPRLAFVSPHLEQDPFTFQEAAQPYAKLMDVDVYGVSGEGKAPLFSVSELAQHDLVIFESLGARVSLLQPQLDSLKKQTKVLFLETPLAEGNVEIKDHPALAQYWGNGNAENYKRLLAYIGHTFFGLDVQVLPPLVYPERGFYYPASDSLFAQVGDYLSWYKRYKQLPDMSDQPVIGLAFYQSSYVKDDLAHIQALIANIEAHGAIPVPFMAKGRFQLDSAFMIADKPIVDAVLYGGMFLDFAHPDQGRAAAAKLDVPLLGTYTHYYKDVLTWEGDKGGFAPEMSDRFYFTEQDGAIEPLLVGAESTDEKGRRKVVPIDYQVNYRVERALAWARLRHKSNRDKKIVITYYSEGNGKANVGADLDAYLDVPGSLAALLRQLRAAGYDVGTSPLPDARDLAQRMANHASNVGVWAPAVLQERKKQGSFIRVTAEEYQKGFAQYPDTLQREAVRQWGRAPGDLMTAQDSNGKKEIIIPILQFGNIVLAPHPNWGLQDNPDLIYNGQEIAPHHAYIAFYDWMKNRFQADAFVSLFTQLSLMPGKAEGPSIKDWNGALLGTTPHITVSPLIGGSGSKNKRRANALTIGYLTDITQAGLSDSLVQLKQQLDDWSASVQVRVKQRLESSILNLAHQLHLENDLGYAVDSIPIPTEYIPQLQQYVTQLAKQYMPYGGHVLGAVPQGQVRTEMIKGMLGGTDSLKKYRDTKAKRYARWLDQTPNELTQLLRALDGHYIVTGPTDDPIRNPESLPSGRNPVSVNTQGIPTQAAWQVGERMADQLLVQFEKEHGAGKIPQKVAFVLWSSEITHNEGVTEAEIMHLIGVEPVWNKKGQIMDVRLIQAKILGRPRIDILITTSGTYRDHFGHMIKLLDKAIQLANKADEPGNLLRQHSLAYQKQLQLDSLDRAGLRIFSSDQGAYSTNLEFAAEKGETWAQDSTLSDMYLDRMSHAYGEKVSALHQKELFRLNIQDMDAAAFSRSSSVYGIMDHPMVAAYFGAYNLVARNTSGKQPTLFINDLQDTAAAAVTPLDLFFHRELRSRYLNPKWINGMKAHGYDGARYMQAFTENMYLWNVTSPDLVNDQDWNAVYETYIKDRYQLDMQTYFDKNNPYALETLTSTMLEASERGYWQASAEQLAALAETLSQTIAEHGVACNTAVCHSPKLSHYVQEILEKVPGGKVKVTAYQRQLAAIKTSGVQAGSGSQELNGKKIEEESLSKAQTTTDRSILWIGSIGLILLLFFLWGWLKPR